MNRKNLAAMAVLLCGALTPAVCAGQAAPGRATPVQPVSPQAKALVAAPVGTPVTAPAANPSGAPSATPTTVPGASPSTAAPGSPETPTDELPPPHISIATPAPAPAPWPVQDRISWAANLLLLLIAYIGVMLALSALRKIERQTRSAETAAQAAAESAQAAMQFAQNQAKAQADAERPWILVTAEPEPGIPNGFTVVAGNRGRSPARIISMAEEITLAKDESQLPLEPAFKSETTSPREPLILLPGESVNIKSIRRDSVNSICTTPEDLDRVETWESRIYLYGKIVYEGLVPSGNGRSHETSWCCWYIHGHQKSGLVIAGPREYNQHT